MKKLITGIKRLALALCLATPIVSWAATSTYSTYSNDTDTPSAGGAYNDHQRFQLNADWMFLASGDDIASTSAAVSIDSIKVYWPSSAHQYAVIGKKDVAEQPDAYLVVTTPQGVVVGVSAVNDKKWAVNDNSTFAFTDVVISPNAQYYFYFATDVSSVVVGETLSGVSKDARVLCTWHGSGHTADETVRIGASNQYSVRCDFTVSEGTATTVVTTGAEAVNLATGTDSVVVNGAVADGVVNVASGAEYPSVTVVGEATTLKLADSITATYLYLPATTTIDASDVTLNLPGAGETTKETVLVAGKISSAADPSVTLPASVAEGYNIETLVRDDSGIKAVVTKPVDATITLDGTEQKWSEVKPEGWVNSSVPVINIDNSVAGTLIFDEDVQAAKIHTTKGSAVNFVRGDGVSVNVPVFSAGMTYMRVTFTDFDAIPQTNHATDGNDQITAAGTTTLTSFPQIDATAQGANLVINQPATFTDNGIYVTGSKTVDINSTISTSRIVLGNQSGTTQVVNQNGGSITITGTAGPGNTSASVLLGHWNSTSTFKTLGGTFTANNVASRLGWDGTTTWQIGGGNNTARVNVYGIVNGQNGHTGSGTLNIMANGTLNLGAGGIQFSNSGNGGNINLAGGTIDTGATAVTITNAKAGGTIINQNKTTTVNVDAEKTLTIDAVLSGSGVGTLKKTGAGKLVLAQTATSVGKLLVNAGTVEFNEDVNWSTSGSVEVATDGTLNILTAEDVAEGGLLRAGTFIVQGTVQNNGTPVDVVVKSNGLYVAEPAPTTVTVTVPDVPNTTVVVTVGGEPVVGENGSYVVPEGSEVVVTYTAVDGYELTGTASYTIDSATEGAAVTPAITTKQYVASITVGENTTKYTSLQAAVTAVAQNKDIVLLANDTEGATVSREVTFSVVPSEYTYGDIVADGDYILTTTALEGKTRYSVSAALIAVTKNDVRTLYPATMDGYTAAIEAANAGPIGTTLEVLSGDPTAYVEYLPMFDLNTDTGVFTKVANPVAAVYQGVIQQQVYRTLAAAFEAAQNNQTVKLLADVTITEGIEITDSVSVTLDMDSKTITYSPTYAKKDYISLFNVAAGSTLTIDGNGEIVGPENGAAYDSKVVISVSGTLNYLNGKLTATGSGSDGMYGVYVLDGGTATFGVENSTTGPNITSHFAAIGTNNTTAPATITVYSGTYTANANPANKEWWSYFCAPVYAAANGWYTLAGGTFNGYYGLSTRYANTTQTITLTGATLNATSGLQLFIDTKTGTGTGMPARLITSVSNEVTIPETWKWVPDTVLGNFRLVDNSGIDPSGYDSTQEVKVTEEEVEAAGGAEAAAIAKASVKVPDTVIGEGKAPAEVVDAATYKTYFNFTVTDKGDGVYEVAFAEHSLKQDVVLPETVEVGEETINRSEKLLEAVLGSDDDKATIPSVPGIYYWMQASNGLDFKETSSGTTYGDRVLAEGTTVTLPKPEVMPSGDAIFFRVRAGVTPGN